MNLGFSCLTLKQWDHMPSKIGLIFNAFVKLENQRHRKTEHNLDGKREKNSLIVPQGYTWDTEQLSLVGVSYPGKTEGSYKV
jgi:hypothetical protein